MALTHSPETVAVVDANAELPDVVQIPDEIYDEDLTDNVVYIDDEDEAKWLMGVLNYDDAG